MKQSKQRRAFVGALAMAGIAGKAFAASTKATADRPVAASDTQYTQWGWPLPYKRVSDTSVAWLKERGWWPLALGWQAPWSGQNAVMAVMDRQGLLSKRGLEQKFSSFASGPALNEQFIAAKLQVGASGNFPVNSMVDKQVPLKVISIVCPNLRHHVIVPLTSPIKSVKDFIGGRRGKGNEPFVIGLTAGSSAEFYFQSMADFHGLKIGKDVLVKNMTLAEQAQMPQDVDAVVPWDFTCSLILEEKKNGRSVDVSYPYNIYQGSVYVRKELIDNVPDVVQAITDAVVEATLWIRLNPVPTVRTMQEEPQLKDVSTGLLLQQVLEYNNLYKPTYLFPFVDFWAMENVKISNWLYLNKRLQKPYSANEFGQVFAPEFMTATFENLGWKIPGFPPTISTKWRGRLGQLPYPPYDTMLTMKSPQVWPQGRDLKRAYTFNGQVFQPSIF